jgi:hypothetical protein
MERKNNRTELVDLFQSQLNQLLKFGYPQEIIQELELKREEVLKLAETIDFPEDHLPFIPVIPEKVLSYRDQATFTSGLEFLKRTLDVRGKRHYLLAKFTNTYAPNFNNKPYYIIDVALVKSLELERYSKVNHEEGFAISIFNQKLILDGGVIAATACTWEGYETAIVHLTELEPGYHEYYTAVDWEVTNKFSKLYYGFCRHRVM